MQWILVIVAGHIGKGKVMKKMDYDSLGIIQQKLLKAAQAVLENSYCPYSNFSVGAALATPNETIITGANVENSAYGSSICAERAAICHANAIGERVFTDLAIVTRDRGFSPAGVAAPCGACRQMLWEFSSLYMQELIIVSATYDLSQIAVVSLTDLLPNPFGPGDLGLHCKP